MIKNVLREIVSDQSSKPDNVILQIYEIKKMGGGPVVFVTDGNNYIEANFDANYKDLFEKNQLQEGQLILVEDFTVSSSDNRPVINILSMQPKEVKDLARNLSPLKHSVKKQAFDYTPISALSTFLSDWTLRAKVLRMSELKEFQNKKSGRTDKMLSVVLLDNYKKRINARFFADAAVKFAPLLREDRVYLFSGGLVNLAEQKYRTPDTNYHLTFPPGAQISEDSDQSWELESTSFYNTLIKDIGSMPERSMVDTCGVILEVSPILDKISRKGENLRQRLVKIADKSNTSIEISIWNEAALDPRLNGIEIGRTVLVGKNLIISHYNSINLSTTKLMSELQFDPDLPIVAELKEWYAGNKNLKTVDLSYRAEAKNIEKILKSLAEIKNSAPGDEKYQAIAYLRFIKTEDTQLTYEACVNCKKKVSQDSSGFYFCLGCKKSNKECSYRYLFRSITLGDFSGSLYATAFNEFGDVLFKMNANEFHAKSEAEKKDITSKAILSRYSFTIRVSKNQGQDGVSRIDYTVAGINYIDHCDVTKKILDLISTKLRL